jgi:hypothetical protein
MGIRSVSRPLFFWFFSSRPLAPKVWGKRALGESETGGRKKVTRGQFHAKFQKSRVLPMCEKTPQRRFAPPSARFFYFFRVFGFFARKIIFTYIFSLPTFYPATLTPLYI